MSHQSGEYRLAPHKFIVAYAYAQNFGCNLKPLTAQQNLATKIHIFLQIDEKLSDKFHRLY